MFSLFADKSRMIAPEEALPGRARPIPTADTHAVKGIPLTLDVPPGLEVAVFGMGCFWGVERMFWKLSGVHSTMVGYGAGHTPNPTYEEVCTGRTGHNELVRVVYDPKVISYEDLLKVFWENHDPTQGMRQGNDVGTQYRSAIYTTTPEQAEVAERLTKVYGEELAARGLGAITTEVRPAPTYYYAEDHHQQYLAKHVNGYRCHANTGVPFPSDS